MKKSMIAGLVGLAFSSPTFAADADIQTDDVVVTASRISQAKESMIADVTVINREEIERAGQSTLIQLLQTQPGVQVSANGGAGKVSSVFLRGTNAEHVVVLVDGMRLNSATLGTTAFENLPLAQIEKIEILRGPASSLYGADAIGGVIQIFTKRSEDALRLSAAVGYGTYNTKTAEASASGKLGDTRYSLSASSYDTDGFSARRIRSGRMADDDGYRNLSVTGALTHTLAEGHELGVQFLSSQGHSNYDSSSSFDNYTDMSNLSYSFYSKNQITQQWRSTLRAGAGIDDSTDHSSPTGRSVFTSKQAQYSWQNDITLPLGIVTLLYDRLEQRVTSTTDYAKTTRSNNGLMASYLLDIDKHMLQASYRSDHNTQYGSHDTGGVGYGYRVDDHWRVSGSYGSAFKVPSFNQLYFPNFGDPALSPEKSDNIEASLKFADNQFKAGVTVFENHIRDLIAFTGPATSGCAFGGFCPVNVGKVEIQGVTFDGSWHITDSLTLSGNYTVQSPRDSDTDQLLVRRGNRYGAVNLLHTWGDLQWGAEVTGASERYNNAANTKEMAGYMLVNLSANYRITPEWKLEARANNIFDKNYVLAFTGNTDTSAAYNTPGANMFVGLRYDMKP